MHCRLQRSQATKAIQIEDDVQIQGYMAELRTEADKLAKAIKLVVQSVETKRNAVVPKRARPAGKPAVQEEADGTNMLDDPEGAHEALGEASGEDNTAAADAAGWSLASCMGCLHLVCRRDVC